MDAVIAFWNDSKDDFQNIATKYANGIRWYAAEGLNQQAVWTRRPAVAVRQDNRA